MTTSPIMIAITASTANLVTMPTIPITTAMMTATIVMTTATTPMTTDNNHDHDDHAS